LESEWGRAIEYIVSKTVRAPELGRKGKGTDGKRIRQGILLSQPPNWEGNKSWKNK
jgi:hypothetical protein